MNEIMTAMIAAFTAKMATFQGIALGVLGLACTIDLLWSVFINFEQDYMKTLPIKIIKYGMWYWIISTYPKLLDQTTGYFTSAVGGEEYLKDPGKVVIDGIKNLKPLIDHAKKAGFSEIMTVLSNLLIWLLAMIGYSLVAFQIFITALEYHVVTTLAILLLPFGPLPRTAFLAEKAIGAIISFSIKLMVLAFMAQTCVPMLATVDNINGNDFQAAAYYVIKVLSIGYLIWQGPGVAAGMLSGSPSLSGGGAVGAAGGMVMGAATGGLSTAGGIIRDKWNNRGSGGDSKKESAVEAFKAAAGGGFKS